MQELREVVRRKRRMFRTGVRNPRKESTGAFEELELTWWLVPRRHSPERSELRLGSAPGPESSWRPHHGLVFTWKVMKWF